MNMDYHNYLAWVSEIDDLSPDQRIATVRLLGGQPSLEAVIGLLEERIGTARRCPHCAAGWAVIRGHSDGLKRYSCKICGKTFNALTVQSDTSDHVFRRHMISDSGGSDHAESPRNDAVGRDLIMAPWPGPVKCRNCRASGAARAAKRAP